MDAAHLPAVIGICAHCGLPLYADAPIAITPPLAHVACAVDQRRHAAPQP